MRESKKQLLHVIGELCRNYRIINGHTLKDVASQMGRSISSIGYFERGRNDSAEILTWYVTQYKISMDKIMQIYDLYTWGKV